MQFMPILSKLICFLRECNSGTQNLHYIFRYFTVACKNKGGIPDKFRGDSRNTFRKSIGDGGLLLGTEAYRSIGKYFFREVIWSAGVTVKKYSRK